LRGRRLQGEGLGQHSLEDTAAEGNADQLQARGKWMIPAYKTVLYTTFGCSMYMMGRLVLVGFECVRPWPRLTPCRDTRPGSART